MLNPTGSEPEISHAVDNARFAELRDEVSKDERDLYDIMDDVSKFIEQVKKVECNGAKLVAQQNLLNHLYALYYEIDRKIVCILSHG